MSSRLELPQAKGRTRSYLPYGIRILACARAIRWIGWGMGEALVPVFILNFSNTFTEMGLLSSMVEIAALASLPVIGVWADRVPAKRLILFSLLLYPLVGGSYFLAGTLGAAALVLLARILNGFAWELENIGVETYYRRTLDRRRIATAFGYLDTWSHAAWIVAALVGMVLVLFLPIHYLLLGIAPFALVAYVVARKAPTDFVNAIDRGGKTSLIWSFGKAVSEWRAWNSQLWLLSVLVLFSSIVNTLMYFFIPINAYLSGANLWMVVLLAVFGAMPALFGQKLGQFADANDTSKLVSFSLVSVAVVIFVIVIFPQYGFKLFAVFVIGIILELLSVVKSSLITTLGSANSFGVRGSAFESIVTFGDLTAPLALGFGLDLFGFSSVSTIVAGMAVLLSVVYHVNGTQIYERGKPLS